MNLLSALHTLLGGHPQQQQQSHPAQGGLQAFNNGADITYNPNQHTNIPNSVHSIAEARQWMGHAQPQQALQAHQAGTSQLGVLPQGSRANLGVPYMYDRQGFTAVGQGARFNPGFTPLQNSGFGPGGNPQIRAFQDQPGQLASPQFNPQANPNQQHWL